MSPCCSLRRVEILVWTELLSPTGRAEVHLNSFADKSIFPNLECILLLDHRFRTVSPGSRSWTGGDFQYVRGWRDRLRHDGIALLGGDGEPVISEEQDRWGGWVKQGHENEDEIVSDSDGASYQFSDSSDLESESGWDADSLLEDLAAGSELEAEDQDADPGELDEDLEDDEELFDNIEEEEGQDVMDDGWGQEVPVGNFQEGQENEGEGEAESGLLFVNIAAEQGGIAADFGQMIGADMDELEDDVSAVGDDGNSVADVGPYRAIQLFKNSMTLDVYSPTYFSDEEEDEGASVDHRIFDTPTSSRDNIGQHGVSNCVNASFVVAPNNFPEQEVDRSLQGMLPCILRNIVHFALSDFFDPTLNGFERPVFLSRQHERKWTASVRFLKPFLLVCRSWNVVGTQALYYRVHLGRVGQLCGLVRTLEESQENTKTRTCGELGNW